METHQSAWAYRWVVIIVIKVDIDFFNYSYYCILKLASEKLAQFTFCKMIYF